MDADGQGGSAQQSPGVFPGRQGEDVVPNRPREMAQADIFFSVTLRPGGPGSPAHQQKNQKQDEGRGKNFKTVWSSGSTVYDLTVYNRLTRKKPLG